MAWPESDTSLPPALLVGGAENAVSAARALVRRGVEVVVVAEDDAPAHRSRGVRSERIGPAVDAGTLAAFFDGPAGHRWEGAAVLALSDPVLRHLAIGHDALSTRFRLTRMVPSVVLAMLDKQRTVDLARAAGVPVPQQWVIDGEEDLPGVEAEVLFPVLVKPRDTFELVRRMGRKFLWAHDADELRHAVKALADLPGGISVLEFVPGPDSRLCSYYALRHDGLVLGELTKRIERRHPRNEGGATLHRMERRPDAITLGRRLFDHVGLEGVGNVEFKLDVRDGQLKLIECNHRLTAATELVQRSGMDLVGATYRQAIGEPVPFEGTAEGRWFWYPARDLRAARQLPATALLDWLRTPLRRPVLPYLAASDPFPAVQHAANQLRGVVARRRRR